MEDLPNEIIVDITSHLTLSDKLNLACACKKLHNIISENTLYNKLVFNDDVKFDQALNLCDEKDFGQQVHVLCFVNMKYDVQLVSALPNIFPHIQFLELQGGSNQFSGFIDKMNVLIFKVAAKNWKTIKSIVDSSKFTNLTLRLLELLTFDHLTSLELSCDGEGNSITNYRRKRTQELIKVLRNAPSLEKLKFSDAAIKIADMEDLHAAAAKLEVLELMDVDIYNDDVEDYPVHYSADNVKRFSLNGITTVLAGAEEEGVVQEGEMLEAEAIKNWILYIGRKYPQVRELCLDLDLSWDKEENLFEEKESIGMSLAIALTNMEHIKGYSVDFCSVVQPLLDAMKTNDVKLNHFGFSVDTNDMITIRETLASVQTARPVSNILSLEMHLTQQVNALNLSNSLTNLCHSLKYLTRLEIESNNSTNAAILFIDILQNLTMLKHLVYRGVAIDENLANDLFHHKVSTINAGRLETMLTSVIPISKASDSIKRLNLLFTFILQSCPKLKIFDVSASDISARGVINLDFRKNHSLQQIELDMENCRYYTFCHEFGKHWKNVKDEIMMDDLTLEQETVLPFSVNLAWDISKNIEVNLSGCGL